ncbi:MAG: prenyltransferase [Thiomonas sp.]
MSRFPRPSRLFVPLILAASLLASGAARAASLERVDALLEAGQLSQADQMIAQVLAAQPNSAQAHYLDARLLAREGKWPLAEQELKLARRLDPTLGFAPAQQVQSLTQTILEHRWKSPAGLAGYGQAALAALFVLVSGYLIFGVMRSRGKRFKA